MAQRSKVGHYDIVAELGRGGMGVVYKGYEASLHRHVAIKMLSESLADDTSVVERFFREARSMAQLNDPHIVQIYLVGEDQGQPFFAMEFVEGESLSQRLKRERCLEPIEASRILLQVAMGLASAHDRGVIHRDIKPANLLMTQRGLVKVADFGIALATQDFNKKLTGTGQFVGTPGYLSPEVCLGKQVDQRSDVFALGIVYFEMLTGQSPYKDESPLGMMLEVVQAGIPDVRQINASIDPQLSRILQRMVAKDPNDRYSDCHQLIGDLLAAGINPAVAVTAPRPIPGPIVGTVVNAPTPPEIKRLSPVPIAAVAPSYRTDQSIGLALAPIPMPLPVGAPAAQLASQTRKPSALPWAIAVALLIGAGGAGAWYLGAFQTQQPNSAIVAGSSSSAGATAFAVAEPPGSPPVASPSTSSVSPAVPESELPATAGVAKAADSDPSQNAASLGGDTTSDQQTLTLTQQSAQTESAGDQAVGDARTPTEDGRNGSALGRVAAVEPIADAEYAPTEDADDAEAAYEESTQSTPTARAGAPALTQSPQSAAVSARFANLRDQRLARREKLGEGATAPRFARVEPPVASEPAYRGTPRVIVLSIGDEAVAAPAEMAIEDSLSERGLTIVDEDLIKGVSRFENGGEPAVAQLVAAAERHAEFVIVVRAVPLGETQLTYYGESTTQYTARLQVGAYDVRRARKLGNGWQAQVSFTHLNADPNTREALEPLLGRIAQNVGAGTRG